MNIVTPENKREKAVLIGLCSPPETPRSLVEEYLDELAFLADTAGADVEATFIQDKKLRDPAYCIGKGKVEELVLFVKEKEIDLSLIHI